MRFSPYLTTLLVITASASALSAEPAPECPRAREFITTLEFLRQDVSLKVPETQARTVATAVSAGCGGAAQRFIRVAKLLNTSGFGGNDSLEEARALARATDAETDTFIIVFRQAFLGEYLDLDLRASLNLAKSLSTSFEGDTEVARSDFNRIIQLCLSAEGKGGLNLPRPACAQFAADIARIGMRGAWKPASTPTPTNEKKKRPGVSEPFIRALNFLREDPTGPALTSAAALQLAREVVERGPEAEASFVTAYRYASSKKGLDLARAEAIAFARELSGGGPAPKSAR